MKSIMEKILGGNIHSTAEIGIDGLEGKNGNKVIFFEVRPAETSSKAFFKLTNASDPPYACNGGASEYGCSIETPNGIIYHALKIHGDVDGWKKDVEFGAEQLGFSLAAVRDNKFIVDGNQEYELNDCAVDFF